YKLPVVCVVLNNSGIYRGMLPEDMKSVEGHPTLHFRLPFQAFEKTDGPSVINVIISTDSERKAQAHPWLTRSKV
ncbi:hypothetical protein GCK32_022206, partial [Trichostrongylus colubriformis]